jgi:hypothetical protein
VFHHSISPGIYCTLITLSPFIILPYPCPRIQQLSVCFIAPSSYTDAMYFDIIHSLPFSFPFPPPPSPFKQPLLLTCSLYMYIYNRVCICVYIYLLNLSSIYERKSNAFVFLTLAISLNTVHSSLLANITISFFFWLSNTQLCISTTFSYSIDQK